MMLGHDLRTDAQICGKFASQASLFVHHGRGVNMVIASVPLLESSVMSGPDKIRSRGSWSHIVSKATDA